MNRQHSSADDERGQVGIGTLIVFIAMVLVAAIAAGVLVNTAGFLQSKAADTGERSVAQVSDRLQVVVATGNVNPDGSADGIADGTVDAVNVTVTQAPGAASIDLRNATVSWIGPAGTHTLTHENASEPGYSFGTTPIKAVNSDPVLDTPDDRFSIDIALGAAGSAGPDRLDAGQEARLVINTRDGARVTVYLTVPDSVDGRSSVEL
ncbi:archaellin/type IV pilin N-terminal domain-containing protein [Halobaculum marinum]|uniref:Flagellin n=1 Tax=Halobaculum marinum TaxID=3031996 RepID=A0ABD5WUK9_9EURY|nr:archaellin/type IV pilin N-terminal domain-containing protein [Halobaculum sp. DT55]